MKAAGYRSAPNYTSRVLDFHIDHGGAVAVQLERAIRKANRSATRGIGPSRQKGGLDLFVVAELGWDESPVTPGGPMSPVEMAVVVSFFGGREIEGSLALAAHFTLDEEKLGLTWMLPSSKTEGGEGPATDDDQASFCRWI